MRNLKNANASEINLSSFEKEFGLKVNEQGNVVVDSRVVADRYGKEHSVVVRKIKQFIDLIPELNGNNFALAKYVDVKNETRPMYEMDRQGFAMLVNKFTGNEALKFTYQYTKAFEVMTEEIERLKTDNKDLYNIATSCESQTNREYKAKVKRYAIKNIRTVLSECTYKDIEDTVDDIINFHATMKKTDRYVSHTDKNSTQYKQYIRAYMSDLLEDIYNTCDNGDLRVIALRLCKDVIKDRLETSNRSNGKIIPQLKNKYANDMCSMGKLMVEIGESYGG